MSLKRRIYGLPLLKPYRSLRARQIASRPQLTSYGFNFAGYPMYLRDDWEREERSLVELLLPRSTAFVDVGASHGFFSCMAAVAGLHTVALEPEPESARVLKENVRLNQLEIEIYPVAVSDAVGVQEFYGDGDTASLMRGWSDAAKYFRQLVPTTTLDRLVSDRWPEQQIVIKIDVEGAEGAALKGAAQLLGRSPKPFWLIETFPAYPTGIACEAFTEVFRLMFDAGYECRVVGPTRSLVSDKMVAEWAKDPETPGRELSNFIFYDPVNPPGQ